MVYDEESMVRVVADGHTDVFDYLQEQRLQVDWLEGRACLVCKALGCENMSMMRRLVETTSQLHDHTVAFIKVCRGNGSDKTTQTIEYLMEKKATVRINGIDREQYSSFSTLPLIAACGASNLELAKLLLTHGADVGIVVQHGSQYRELDVYASTPLIVAAGLGNLEQLRLLLERGANPNQESPQHDDRYCFTPLSQACFNGRDAVVRELLSLEALEVDSTRLSAALAKAMYAQRGARQTLETLLKWHFRRGVDEDVLRKAIDAVPKGRAELVDVVLEYSPSDVRARE